VKKNKPINDMQHQQAHHLKALTHQAAGHVNSIFTDNDDDTLVLKPTVESELAFYEAHANGPLQPFLPRFDGTRIIDGQKMIALENLMHPFVDPCVLDLKIGLRTTGEHASAEKIAAMHQKDISTTTHTLGLRICGMQVNMRLFVC
jgi:hypothetical protein